ncbi:hypothetical protein BDZ89DRAFT_610741 [Hymenopellis radicata]|nr:hypothetical protein BDZ89DRAFT_610741 [Hymenopellis radicata]
MTQTVTPCYAERWPRQGRGLLAALKLPFTCDLAACRVSIGGCNDTRGGCRWHDHGRHFETLERLQEHFRGSPHHPTCQVCGLGVKDDATLRRHLEESCRGKRAPCPLPRCRKKVYHAEEEDHRALFHPDWCRCPVDGCELWVPVTLVHQHLSSAHPAPRWVCPFAGCEETIPRDKANMVKEHLASAHLVCMPCRFQFLDRVTFFIHDLEFHRPAY